MDDLDTVGRYGTVALIRKNTFQAVTSFPVDDERTTFGRDPKCSVRMYFHDVDPLHCTLYFEDGKAYIHVKGQGGITVDDALVPPGASVCLNNGSRFMIWRKLFQFTYPPREIRAALLATPRSARKSLRMSMIHSSVILTPRHKTGQALDLRTLQSPLKPYREAPQEVVTFVDSDQIAVVEDGANAFPSPITSQGTSNGDDDVRALIALEEIELDENDDVNDEFARSPSKRSEPRNPFLAPPRPSFTPLIPLPPSSQPLSPLRRTESQVQFHSNPATNSPVRSPLPNYPYQERIGNRRSSVGFGTSEPPARHHPPSSLVPRDQWRGAVASGSGSAAGGSSNSGAHVAQPPRTPRRKSNRMSMHKAVLVRSAHRAHIAALTAQEEQEDEQEVEQVVSPERKAGSIVPLIDFGSDEDEDDDDAEGEADFDTDETTSEQASSSSAVIQTGANIFSAISTFVRRSLSPERKPIPPKDTVANPFTRDELEEGEIAQQTLLQPLTRETSDEQIANRTKQALRLSPPPSQPSGKLLSFTTPVRPLSRRPSKLYTPQNHTSQTQERAAQLTRTVGAAPKDRAFRFDFKPFKGWGTTKEESSVVEDVSNQAEEQDDKMDIDETPPSEQPRPVLGNFLTPQTQRVAPIDTNTVARGPAPALTSFLGKPVRPSRTVVMDLGSAGSSQEPNPQPEPEEKPSPEKVAEAWKDRELRALRRQSALAAIDAGQRRPLADPSTRKSWVLQSVSKRRASSVAPSDTPSRSTSPVVEAAPPTEEKPTVSKETDISSAQDSDDEQPVGLEQLKANIALMKRESMARAARLSLGTGLVAEDDKSDTEIPLFGGQSNDENSLDTSKHITTSAEATSGSQETLVDGVEVDITELTTEEPVASQTPTRDATATEAVPALKQPVTTVDVEVKVEENSSTATPTTVSTRRLPPEPINASPKRSRKRAAEAPLEETVRRSTRRKIVLDTDDEPPTAENPVVPLRRGRSATPARSTTVAEPPGSIASRTQRATSQEPQTAASSSVSTRSRTTRSRSRTRGLADVEEAEEEGSEVKEETTVSHSAPTKLRSTSRIANANAITQSVPPKRSVSTTGPKQAPSTAVKSTTSDASTTEKTNVRRRIPRPIPVAAPSMPRAIKRVRDPTDEGDAPTRDEAGPSGQRVSRSTRSKVDVTANAAPSTDGPSPKKRRKEVAIKEETDVTPPTVPLKPTPLSRVPTVRATTSTRRTPLTRHGSTHDKENSHDSLEGSASTGKEVVKPSRLPSRTASMSKVKVGTAKTPTTAKNVVAAETAGRSLRTRGKK